jgi:cytoskeletal protein RodZ
VRGIAVVVFAGIFFLFWLGSLSPVAAQSQPSVETGLAPSPAAKAHAQGTASKSTALKSTASKPTSAKNTTPSKKKPAASTSSKKKHKTISPRVRRVRRAFVASASLRPMAQQLLQDRTTSAYAGV